MKFFKFIVAYCFISLIAFSGQSIAANKESSMEQAILFHINQYRKQHGLKPLTMNKAMSVEAARHSRDMAKHAIPFGHLNFHKRIQRLYKQIKHCQGGAENVAYAYKDANDVVKNWLTSTGHRRNIVGNYNLTGIGVARDSNGKLYFTQLFLKTAALTRN